MKSTTDDIELLQNFKSGDQQALDHIFNKYWKDLYLHALKLTHDEHAADEIVQKLFINLWVKRTTLSIQSLSHYLHMSVRNGSIDYMRSELSRDTEWSYYSKFIPTMMDSPEEEYLNAEVYEKLQSILNLLPKQSKEIFEKNKMEGLSALQIAQEMNLPKRSVEYQLAKIKDHLRKEFRQFLFLLIAISGWIHYLFF